MSDGIIIAIITGLFTFAGVLVTKFTGNNKLVTDIKTENDKIINAFKLEVTKNQAITDTKITELTREVREHNNFAKRMPVVENDIKHIKEKMSELHKND
jgi:hypothetical protein